jgi:transposase InsO family protein
MRCQAIHRRRAEYPVAMMCRLLAVARSTYYAWARRPESARARANRQLVSRIRVVYQESDRTYGSPRIHEELRAQGVRCSEHRIARLMRLHRIRAKQARRFTVTTDAQHGLPVAPNLLNRQFAVDAPDRVWMTDLTYLWTGEGWVYLAVVMDLFSRRIVGWAMQPRLTKAIALEALHGALVSRQPGPALLHHSDRGSQYASTAYQAVLQQHEIQCSMSRAGDCWDNAVVESFFASLKTERVQHRSYRTRSEAQADVFDYIERFYNRKRRHSSLGYLSPAEYEQLNAA